MEYLEFKGYTGTVEYDKETGYLHGKLIGIKDFVTYTAKTRSKLQEEFIISICDYEQFLEETKQKEVHEH